MQNVFVGKDVIELVGNAMYLDPLTIYREYIQNSVDAIDEAVEAGLLNGSEESRVDITIDNVERRIVIRDNGVGISSREFLSRMLSIGASKKRRTSARGFRGVGRLSGLGYCQELIFRTRVIDDKVCELKWNVRAIKMALAGYKGDGEIGELIKDVTEYSEYASDDYPDHFFEVEMIKPVRTGGDILMNVERVEKYIAQNAPVPFSPTFSLADQIREHVGRSFEYKEYNIYLNENQEPVHKAYEDTIPYSDTKIGVLNSAIVAFEVESIDGDVAATGWVAHHDYQGAIAPSLLVGGLRARVGNIQVGGRNVFSDVFPEERFNSWAIGEIYIFDKGLIPNGRRDGFEHNNHLNNLKNQLLPYAHEVARQCRKQSSLRNNRKRIDLALEKASQITEILSQGSLGKASAEFKASEAKSLLVDAEALIPSAELSSPNESKVRESIAEIQAQIDIGYMDQGGLTHLPEVEQKAFKKVFELLYECAPNQVVAKSLIDKVIARI